MKKLLILAALAAAPASAHVVFDSPEATAGSYYAGVFRVGHGCDAAATTAVRIEVPESIIVARPQPKPGWTVEIERAPLATPVASEGHQLRERVAAITWRGNLPADQFDAFGLMLKLPQTASGAMYLPVVQRCGTTEVRWGDIPAEGQRWHEVKRPAPVLRVVKPETVHQH